MRSRTIGAIVALAAVGGLAYAAVPANAAAPSASTIDWGTCPDFDGPTGKARQASALECGTLEVPLDYSKPNGKTIEVAVSRLRSTDPEKRRGVLLLNPGGPGGPGLDLPLSIAGLGAPASLLESYDLIGFDPRGIGHSTPVTCGWSIGQQNKVFPNYPKGSSDVADRAGVVTKLADQCVEKAGEALPYITTRNTARDMDQIRKALGEEQISYFGLSYGTYLGTAYAEMFPHRTDRFVLDSAVGPNRVWRKEFRDWGKATELSFPDFAEWAADRDPTYGLGDSTNAVRDTFFELADRVDQAPVAGIGGSLLRQTTHGMLYSDSTFPQLAQFLQSIDGDDADAATEAMAEAGMRPRANDNGAASGMAVLCGDAEWPSSLARYQRDVEADRGRYPMLGAMTANMYPCSRWPLEPKELPIQPSDDGPSNLHVLQNLRDPATIYSGGVELRKEFGDRARLVTVDQGGHGVYLFSENACAANITTAYLVDGEFPAHDEFCGSEAETLDYELTPAPDRTEFVRDVLRRTTTAQ